MADVELDLVAQALVAEGRDLAARLGSSGLSTAELVEVLNQIRGALHEVSPMRDQPVDYVEWVPNTQVEGNAYNPNHADQRAMELLKASVAEDGFTQPIVAWPGDKGEAAVEVVDGFHRHLVGKQLDGELHGYLPVTLIRTERTGLADRMASTYRHNKARGDHTIPGMSEFVLQLKREGKTNEAIAAKLSMDLDEVERLHAQTGLGEAYAEEEFSTAWEPAGYVAFADEQPDQEVYDPFALQEEGPGPTAADLDAPDTDTPAGEGEQP